MKPQKVHLPAQFDPNKKSHRDALLKKITEKYGGQWSIDHIAPDENVAYVIQHAALTSLSDDGAETKKVSLAYGTRASDGDAVAKRMSDIHPGFVMTEFYPAAGWARLTKLTTDEVFARDTIASVFGKKPWDIRLAGSKKKGYTFTLPTDYMPSKYDKKLGELAESVLGAAGWFFRAHPKEGRGEIKPGVPPTLPTLAHYPRETLSARDFLLPVGVTMASGGEASRMLTLNLTDNAGALIVGTSGSGKSVTINAIIAGALARGWDLGIIDVPHKAIDYAWCEDLVAPYCFGARELAESIAVASHVYHLGQERAALLKTYGAQKVADLPEAVRPQPFLLVVDEFTGLMATEKPPSGIGKDNPDYIDAVNTNAMIARLKKLLQQIALELRFVGVRLLVATQQAQTNTGVSTQMKMALPSRLLLGARADKRARTHAFQSPDDAPDIPDAIKDDDLMSKGAGVAEIEGDGYAVFKSFFETTDIYRQLLNLPSVKPTPYPTLDMVRKALPPLLEGGETTDF